MDDVSIDAPNERVSDQHVSFNAFLRAMLEATTIASNRNRRCDAGQSSRHPKLKVTCIEKAETLFSSVLKQSPHQLHPSIEPQKSERQVSTLSRQACSDAAADMQVGQDLDCMSE